jgi:hypothetical protein
MIYTFFTGSLSRRGDCRKALEKQMDTVDVEVRRHMSSSLSRR